MRRSKGSSGVARTSTKSCPRRSLVPTHPAVELATTCMMTSRPPQSDAAEQAAREIIERLLADPDRVLGVIPGHIDPDEAIVVTYAGRPHVPRFQFAPDGTLLPDVAQLKAVLPRDADGGYLDAALWLYAPDDTFAGRTPAEMFATTPARVIKVAHARRFGSPGSD